MIIQLLDPVALALGNVKCTPFCFLS